MTIDHIGMLLFPDILILRILGRLAFPIFAFCIADGLKHTRSIKRYILLLFIFAIISQIPYNFIFQPQVKLNILFTFLIGIAFILSLNKIGANGNISNKFLAIVFLILLSTLCLVDLYLRIIEYSLFGVLLVITFYYLDYNKFSSYLAPAILVSLMTLYNLLIYSFNFNNSIYIFALFALPLIYFYNNEKGKTNIKYLFYIFYPTHLLLLYLIKLTCF